MLHELQRSWCPASLWKEQTTSASTNCYVLYTDYTVHYCCSWMYREPLSWEVCPCHTARIMHGTYIRYAYTGRGTMVTCYWNQDKHVPCPADTSPRPHYCLSLICCTTLYTANSGPSVRLQTLQYDQVAPKYDINPPRECHLIRAATQKFHP